MKEEMESQVARAAVEGLPAVIVNPTLCVDTHDALPTSGKLLCAVARREMPAYLPGVLNVVATRDVAEGLVLAAARGRTGQRYILGHENMQAREFLALIAEVAGVPPPRVSLPLSLAGAVAWVAEVGNLIARRSWPVLPLSGVQMIRYSQPFDCRRAREELGLPQTPVRVAVADALRWFGENGYLRR
jgi:dihydroflavonol-4-reductase